MIARKPTRIVLQSSDKDDLDRALGERERAGGGTEAGVGGGDGGVLAGVASPRQAQSAAERLGLKLEAAPDAPGGGSGGGNR